MAEGDASAGLSGALLDGRYRVDREIGRGGFATVYAGQHLALGVPIAIKVLRFPEGASASHRADLLATFLDEARLLVRLRHENVVRTLDQGVIDAEGGAPTPYIVMEWCGDESLARVIAARRGEGFPLAEAYAIVERVADALAHAHALGVAHRDIKPSNVMMMATAGGALTPRVIDFGIAKPFEATAEAGGARTTSPHRAFTAAYAAPEQLAGARTGPWTDVHAIGLLFVELVTGEAPLGTPSRAGLKAIDPARPGPASFGVDVGAFEPVIQKALALHPTDRYRDAGELLSALREAAAATRLSAPRALRAHATPSLDEAQREPASTERETGGTAPATRETPIPEARPAPKPPRSRLVIATVAASLVAVAAFAARAQFAPRPAPIAPASASSAPTATASIAAAPQPTAEPPPKPRLASWTMDSLLTRMRAEGLTPGAQSSGDDPQKWIQIAYEKGDLQGYLMWNEVTFASAPEEISALASLFRTAQWIVGDKAHGLELAYLVDQHHVLSMTFPKGKDATAIFNALSADVEGDFRGSSASGPNPAMNARETKRGWRAKRIDDVSDLEMNLRIMSAGATQTGLKVDAHHWTFDVRKGRSIGTVHLVMPAAEADAFLAKLRRGAAKRCLSRDVETSIVVTGGGDLVEPAFLREVLIDLPSEVACEPPR